MQTVEEHFKSFLSETKLLQIISDFGIIPTKSNQKRCVLQTGRMILTSLHLVLNSYLCRRVTLQNILFQNRTEAYVRSNEQVVRRPITRVSVY